MLWLGIISDRCSGQVYLSPEPVELELVRLYIDIGSGMLRLPSSE